MPLAESNSSTIEVVFIVTNFGNLIQGKKMFSSISMCLAVAWSCDNGIHMMMKRRVVDRITMGAKVFLSTFLSISWSILNDYASDLAAPTLVY